MKTPSNLDWKGKILLIDAYDSYFYNICSLIQNFFPLAELFIIRHDQMDTSLLYHSINAFDWCILGPGPGNPTNPHDIGLFSILWSLENPQDSLPILGICLGMQTLCHHFGATLKQLKYPSHGIISNIEHTQHDLYEGIPFNFKAVRYHSFYVEKTSTLIETLAWTYDKNGKVLMGVKHKNKPFYGIQYHPESFLSEYGKEIIHNFWKIACKFNEQNKRPRIMLDPKWNLLRQTIQPLGTIINLNEIHNQNFGQFNKNIKEKIEKQNIPISEHQNTNKNNFFMFKILNIQISAIQLIEQFCLEKNESCAILESTSEPGRYSIIGIPSPGHYTLTHTFPDTYLIKTYTDRQEKVPLGVPHIWTWLIDNLYRHIDNHPKIPFLGGFIGYLNYEYGVYTTGIHKGKERGQYPDVNLLFFERSIVLDSIENQIIVQSLIKDDPWIAETVDIIQSLKNKCTNSSTTSIHLSPQNNYFQNTSQTHIVLPNKEEYLKKIQIAQNYINQGESYELCLTSTTQVFSSEPCTPIQDWNLYKHLRTLNPAPFSGYFRSNNITLLSSSPERFLNWTNEGLCELRPIKGTLQKDPSIDLKKATILLKNPKDYAENLMILDLIRNDLCQIAKDVHVPIPMQVEEYKTVYQLVSVIRGTIYPPYTGIDVLAHTLPPGSMTGAPKKRSVELLHKLEKNKRDIYSGVFGYFSVCGGGDWSVIIRSTFRYHNENHWNIGAGGAITSLSNPQQEWDEMILKLQSVLPLFK